MRSVLSEAIQTSIAALSGPIALEAGRYHALNSTDRGGLRRETIGAVAEASAEAHNAALTADRPGARPIPLRSPPRALPGDPPALVGGCGGGAAGVRRPDRGRGLQPFQAQLLPTAIRPADRSGQKKFREIDRGRRRGAPVNFRAFCQLLCFGGYGFLPRLPYPRPRGGPILQVLHLFKCCENLGLGLAECLIQFPF